MVRSWAYLDISRNIPRGPTPQWVLMTKDGTLEVPWGGGGVHGDQLWSKGVCAQGLSL